MKKRDIANTVRKAIKLLEKVDLCKGAFGDGDALEHGGKNRDGTPFAVLDAQ